MRRLKGSSGSLMLITHNLGIVADICEEVVVMYAGRAIERGTLKAIFDNPLHPYTHSLISAIPIPDPQLEKNKVLYTYDPSIHDYSVDKPEWVEILPGHFVYGNTREMDGYRRELAAM